MANVGKLLLVFLLLTFSVNGQSTSEKLKREQVRLERKISNTKSLPVSYTHLRAHET